MISVRNLRQLLNGNNVIFIVVSIVIFQSCSGSKKAVNPSPKDQVITKPKTTDSNNQLPKKIDTVVWNKPSTDDKIIIADKKVETTENKTNSIPTIPKSNKDESSFTVLAMIPFKAAEVDSTAGKIPSASLRFVQFYAGFKMAIDELNDEAGKKVNLNVYDTQSPESAQSILSTYENKPLHLIIGPYKPEAIKLTADWAKLHSTAMISPWVSSSTITDKNPFYIQAKAGLNAHYKSINDHARNHFPVKNIILVSKSVEESKSKYFNDTTIYSEKMVEKIIKEDELANSQNPVLTPLLFETGPTVFILPLALSKDENYVYHFLRRVVLEKGTKEVVVYGMYKWMEMRNEIFDYLNTQKVRLSISNYADNDVSTVRNFKKKYLSVFREFPSDDAMEGYDLAKYCIRSLRNQGSYFYMSPSASYSTLQTQFNLQAVYKTKQKTIDPMQADYFENAYIDIIEIRNGKCKEVN